jgi:mitochondrial fission protein ELM1
MDQRPVIWIITDGKAGHESQSIGLANALDRLAGPFAMESHAASVAKRRAWGPVRNLDPKPMIVIGAGSGTHTALLSCKQRLGARAVVLMNPGVWLRRWVDLVIAPEHDGLRQRGNVVCTRGALTPVRPNERKDPSSGLLLIGGPSSHHGWDNDAMIGQIRAIVERTPSTRWTLTTSRRTPTTFLPSLERAGIDASRLDVWPVERTSREWLLARYDESATIWVSEDSVSMVYEALTSGANVGLLRVPRIGKGSRVVRGVEALASSGFATRFEEWERAGALSPPPEQLDEATRVARIVIERFGLKGASS